MDNSYNAVITKAKVIYGQSLTPDDYDNLLRRNSVKSAVAYLKGTARYANTFDELGEANMHRGDIEFILKRDVFRIYGKLCRFIPVDNNGFLSFAFRRAETEIILTSLTLAQIGEFDKIALYIPEYFRYSFSFDLTALAKADSVAKVLDVFRNTRYRRVLREVVGDGENFDIEEVSQVLRADYYKWAANAAKKEFGSGSGLAAILKRQEEIEKLFASYRIKAFFTPGGEKEADAILDEVDEKYFKGKVVIDRNNLETAFRRDAYNFYRRKLRMAENHAEAIFAFFELMEVQRRNVAAIIESIRYALPINEIEKMLVV